MRFALFTSRTGQSTYSLRTLFLLIFVCAAGLWALLIWLPWHRVQQEDSKFEGRVRQIKLGMTNEEAIRGIRSPAPSFSVNSADDNGHRFTLIETDLPDATFFALLRFQEPYSFNSPCTSVELFRLPPVPQGYCPKTPEVLANLAKANDTTAAKDPSWSYGADFAHVITGDRKQNYGLRYDLIYSDPPGQP
jgi:hypothetical protein